MDKKTTIKKDGMTYTVSTVLLPSYLGTNIPGGDYETCIFWDSNGKSGSEVTARYESSILAEHGHHETVDKVQRGMLSWRDLDWEYRTNLANSVTDCQEDK